MVLLDWVNELMAPCFDPCFDCQQGKPGKHQRSAAALRTLRTPGHEVELCVSPLAGLRGAAGYHTSVLVAGEEYYFCPAGICTSARLTSHQGGAQMQRFYIGLSGTSGAELLEFLSQLFRPGSYDLLRKNCNSFTDCALYFLCEQRLELRYRTVEKLAWVADDSTGLLQKVTQGDYVPNPRAQDFELQAVLKEIEIARDFGSDSEGEDEGSEDNQALDVDSVVYRPYSGASADRKMTASYEQHSSFPGVPKMLTGSSASFATAIAF